MWLGLAAVIGKSCRTLKPSNYESDLLAIYQVTVMYNKYFLASSVTNEINFVVINLFDGIEIKLDIKEHGERVTGYTLSVLLDCYSESQRDVIRPPNRLLSPVSLLLAATKELCWDPVSVVVLLRHHQVIRLGIYIYLIPGTGKWGMDQNLHNMK